MFLNAFSDMKLGLPSFPFILLELFMSFNACSDIKWGLPCFPFILLELFMSFNACSDLNWAYIVFLSYFWISSCPLMHAQIFNGLTLFSFHNFGIIHVFKCMLGFTLGPPFFFILLDLFMSLNACSDMKLGLASFPFIRLVFIHVP